MSMQRCGKCSKKMRAGHRFCTGCGTRAGTTAQAAKAFGPASDAMAASFVPAGHRAMLTKSASRPAMPVGAGFLYDADPALRGFAWDQITKAAGERRVTEVTKAARQARLSAEFRRESDPALREALWQRLAKEA